MSTYIKSSLIVLLLGEMLMSCAAPATPLPEPTPVASTEIPAITATAAPTMVPGDSEHSVNVDGQDRSYILHIPPGVVESTPVPVVIVLHEYTYSVSQTRLMTKFDDLSDSNGIVLVYPKGIGTSWNSGGCCGIAVEDNVDDVEFVQQILSNLEKMIALDRNRIYAAGFSNGAMMAYRLACEMSDVFAAVASVSGTLFYEPCQPEHNVSVLHIHGLGDTTMPFAGGESTEGAVPLVPPVQEGIETWVKLNECNTSPQVSMDGAITNAMYVDCQASTTVELITIDGFEHGWPSPTGAGAMNFPATQTIWEFFSTHPKP